MDQNTGGQNKNDSFFKRNAVSIVIAVVVIAGAIYFSVRDKNNQQANSDQNQEQVAGDSTTNQGTPTPSPTPNPTPSPSGSAAAGNISATGTLKASDNAAKGNLMIVSGKSQIYINTKRDFSSMVDTLVTLNAQGTLQSFVFLGLATAGSTGTPSDDKGGPADGEVTNTAMTGDSVSFAGLLAASDNTAKGNYIITSGKTKVYLQTSKDMTSLVNTQVNLAAIGTLATFTNAKVTAK